MWRKSQSSIKPDVVKVDEASGVVFVRKNITEVELQNEMSDELIKMFEYEENKVAIEDWEVYKTVLSHTDELAEVQDALVELAGIMEG